MVLRVTLEEFFFSIDFIFYSSFRFISKLSGRYRDFTYKPCPQACIGSPIINIPHQSGTFVTADKPTLTYHYHYHPKSTVYIRFILGVMYSMGSDKFVMTCVAIIVSYRVVSLL